MNRNPSRRRLSPTTFRTLGLGLAFAASLGAMTACSRSSRMDAPSQGQSASSPATVAFGMFGASKAEPPPASPTDLDKAPADEKRNDANGASAFARRIIRNATLDVVSKAPVTVRGIVTDIVVSQGGFVLSSDVSSGDDASSVRIVARVPAEKFDATLDAIRRSGSEVARENTSGQDVTEEYADIEARIRAQKAVEAQYMEIMKRATTIADTLSVQQKLGEIRTEIERAEGRRRFLANQSDLSTITVNVSKTAPQPVVETGPGFVRSMKQAGDDALGISVAMINGAIRLTGVMAPALVFFGIPIALVVRSIRTRRRKSAAALA
jgi:hypothetical protein